MATTARGCFRLRTRHLGGLNLLFDERGVHAGVLQLSHNVLGVSQRAQQRRHVGPELAGQVQDIGELPFPVLGPLPDLVPQGAQAQEARANSWKTSGAPASTRWLRGAGGKW